MARDLRTQRKTGGRKAEDHARLSYLARDGEIEEFVQQGDNFHESQPQETNDVVAQHGDTDDVPDQTDNWDNGPVQWGGIDVSPLLQQGEID